MAAAVFLTLTITIRLLNAPICRAQPRTAPTAPAEFEAASITAFRRPSLGGFGWSLMALRLGPGAPTSAADSARVLL